jgi:hypothetical protein
MQFITVSADGKYKIYQGKSGTMYFKKIRWWKHRLFFYLKIIETVKYYLMSNRERLGTVKYLQGKI